MATAIQQPSGRLHGGLTFKSSAFSGIEVAPLPDRVVIQTDNNATLSVDIGDRLLTGQPLVRENTDIVSSHASLSGTVSAIDNNAVTIESDGLDTRYKFSDASEPGDYTTLFRSMGLVGLGGAAFAVDKKIEFVTSGHMVDTLLINAAECDPAIYCDEALMQERTAECVKGIQLARTATNASQCIVGIEDNKHKAIDKLLNLLPDDISLVAVPSVYPSGAENNLFNLCTGKIGTLKENNALCFNIATCYSMFQAAERSMPLISRIVTLIDQNTIRNVELRLGTLISDLEKLTGWSVPEKLICGGQMMGALVSPDSTIEKRTNSLILNSNAATSGATTDAKPCIRCGACVDVCPERLYPQQLFWHTSPHNTRALKELNLERCIDCACCDAVCPSQIPLASLFINAKNTIIEETQEQIKASLAKQRYEKRQSRLNDQSLQQRLKLDRKSARLAAANETEDAKKALIEKALQRSKRRKNPNNGDLKNNTRQ